MESVIAGIAYRLPDTQISAEEESAVEPRFGTDQCNHDQLVGTDHDHGYRHKQISRTLSTSSPFRAYNSTDWALSFV